MKICQTTLPTTTPLLTQRLQRQRADQTFEHVVTSCRLQGCSAIYSVELKAQHKIKANLICNTNSMSRYDTEKKNDRMFKIKMLCACYKNEQMV